MPVKIICSSSEGCTSELLSSIPVHLNFTLPYHEREFKVITVKGTFFHGQRQAMEDGDEYLKIRADIF